MRKGQASIYIILGVILLLIIGLVLVYTGKEGDEKEKLENEKEELKKVEVYVKDCISDISETLILEMASKSGYYYMPANSIYTDYSEIALYYDEGIIKLPRKYEIENDLDSYLRQHVENCLNKNMADFGSFKIESELREESVGIDITLLTKVGDSELDQFLIEIPIRLMHLLKISEDIVNEISKDPIWLDMSELSNYDVKVDILGYNESVFIFSLKDKGKVKDVYFLFGIKIDYELPNLEIEDEFIIKKGEFFSYKLIGEYEFSESSSMFDINNSWINFTAFVPGEYFVVIKAKNEYGMDEKEVRFVINE